MFAVPLLRWCVVDGLDRSLLTILQYFPLKDWWRAFVNLLIDDVKLAGATISCMGSPHVQSYVFATDVVGLDVLFKNGIFDSEGKSHFQVIQNHEIGMSAAILASGYNIASLLWKYRNVDFRSPSAKHCNNEENPLTPQGYDGLTVHPFEVFFVKAKLSEPLWLPMVEKYGKWEAHTDADVTSKRRSDFAQVQRQLTDELLERCGGSFDSAYYLAMHADLRSAKVDPFYHWNNVGRFEGRRARFSVTHSQPSTLCAYVLSNPGFAVWLPPPFPS